MDPSRSRCNFQRIQSILLALQECMPKPASDRHTKSLFHTLFRRLSLESRAASNRVNSCTFQPRPGAIRFRSYLYFSDGGKMVSTNDVGV